MKKADFIKAIAKQAGTSQKEADAVLAATLATIRDALKKGDSVAFLKFGTFKISKRAARKGRNPQTGKEIQIPAAKLPVFKASAAFKELVNGKKAKKKK
ncbi:MAG: HU family DNA-binding protein [Selenomonadaceae bacterium]|nr:HU family DNA-binding protein [Selenomonadaceae bacterium]